MKTKSYLSMKNQFFKKIVFVIIISVAAIIERLWFDLGPNIELITGVTILSTLILGKRGGFFVPLLILAITDTFLGNTGIMLFTWSAFVLEALAIPPLIKKIKFNERKKIKKLIFPSALGAGASLWFYLWTNFGVWFLNSWKMYPKTLNGLISCYFAGLPFLKLNLVSNVLLLPLFFVFKEAYYFLTNMDENNKASFYLSSLKLILATGN